MSLLVDAVTSNLLSSTYFALQISAIILFIAIAAYFVEERAWKRPLVNSLLGGTFLGLAIAAGLQFLLQLLFENAEATPRIIIWRAALLSLYGAFAGAVLAMFTKRRAFTRISKAEGIL